MRVILDLILLGFVLFGMFFVSIKVFRWIFELLLKMTE